MHNSEREYYIYKVTETCLQEPHPDQEDQEAEA